MSKSKKPDFYLSSSEGYGLEVPRACYRQKRIGGRNGDDYLSVHIEPPICGQRFGLGDKDLSDVILATRHDGTSLFPVSEWPLYIHVARLLHDVADKSELTENDLELIGWAEIYRTKQEASKQSK
ncbi:hypothetical protein OAO01_07460 [Oligoflexia bacterium]|nr:hypothetical protein [Oligoflexia bacterium]